MHLVAVPLGVFPISPRRGGHGGGSVSLQRGQPPLTSLCKSKSVRLCTFLKSWQTPAQASIQELKRKKKKKSALPVSQRTNKANEIIGK